MFDTLSDRLNAAFRNLRGKTRLTDADIDADVYKRQAERVSSTASIAAERLRSASSVGTEERPGRDPEAIEREAAEMRRAETELQAEVAARSATLAEATQSRSAAERCV